MAKKLSTTKKGIAVYPRLTGEPDVKFNKAGVWSVKLEQSLAVGADLKEAIDETMKSALVEAKEKYALAKQEYAALKSKSGKKPPKEPTLVDTPYFVDEENDTITFTFKMTASGVAKKSNKPFTQKPTIFDKEGQVVKGDIKLGGGSTIKVSYEIVQFVSPIGAGASLRLKGVQVIDLVEWGSGNAAQHGFESEEGSFSADSVPAHVATPAEEAGFTPEEAEVTEGAPATGSETDDF